MRLYKILSLKKHKRLKSGGLTNYCAYYTMKAIVYTSAVVYDVPQTIDGIDSMEDLLREGRDINFLFATGTGFTALFAGFMQSNTVSTVALLVCVYNLVQAMRKQKRIEIAEAIKQMIRKGTYVRPY